MKELTWGVNMSGDCVALGLAGGEWPINSGGGAGWRTPSGRDMQSPTLSKPRSSSSSSAPDGEEPFKSSLPFTFPIVTQQQKLQKKSKTKDTQMGKSLKNDSLNQNAVLSRRRREWNWENFPTSVEEEKGKEKQWVMGHVMLFLCAWFCEPIGRFNVQMLLTLFVCFSLCVCGLVLLALRESEWESWVREGSCYYHWLWLLSWFD